VSMLCDGGERYLDSYYNDVWLKQNGFDLNPYLTQLDNFYASGKFR
jgi:cysteine synthase A